MGHVESDSAKTGGDSTRVGRSESTVEVDESDSAKTGRAFIGKASTVVREESDPAETGGDSTAVGSETLQ